MVATTATPSVAAMPLRHGAAAFDIFAPVVVRMALLQAGGYLRQSLRSPPVQLAHHRVSGGPPSAEIPGPPSGDGHGGGIARRKTFGIVEIPGWHSGIWSRRRLEVDTETFSSCRAQGASTYRSVHEDTLGIATGLPIEVAP